MTPTLTQTLFLPCAAGTETCAVDEARTLLAPLGEAARVQAARGGCVVELAPSQGAAAVMRLNLGSRLAQRVLWRLAEAPYRDEGDLYALARRVEWPAWIQAGDTFKVEVTAQRSPLRSLNFAALRIKDAVCDVVREVEGERPSVDTRRPHAVVVLHVDERQATLYVDTSGEPLFKRGWREDKGEAPLKETLAAAMLAAAGWQGRESDGPLLDPCCGSGTIAIEAAQIACGMAPGLGRRFAFERLRPFRAHLAAWQSLRADARHAVHAPRVPVHASDVAFRMTDFARRNAERAGVAHAIEFRTVDALQALPPSPSGTLLLNPPYGERIEAKGSRAPVRATPARDVMSEGFFSRLAAHWKAHYSGWTAWVLSPDMQLPSAMRLKESRRVPLWNGPIECRLFRFEMVKGSARERAAPPGAGAPPDATHGE